jgi:hypothetical protein
VAIHAVPLDWTGEAGRLAQILELPEDSAVAEIGAGNGALIVALAAAVAINGTAFATERTAKQRQAMRGGPPRRVFLCRCSRRPTSRRICLIAAAMRMSCEWSCITSGTAQLCSEPA